MIRTSIKWKLGAAMILTGLGLVLVYVVMAKRLFESDKISYVFDSQASRLEVTKREIEQRFERALLSARSVLATYDATRGSNTEAGTQIFFEEKSLLALEVWSESEKKHILKTEKKSGILPVINANEKTGSSEGNLTVLSMGASRFLLSVPYKLSTADAAQTFRLRAVVELDQLFPQVSNDQSLFIVKSGRILAAASIEDETNADFQQIAEESTQDTTDRTKIWGEGASRTLVSTANLGVGGFKLIAVTPEKSALGALKTLFNRSLIFSVFATFGLIVVSITFSREITSGLRILTQAAKRIGDGDFDTRVEVRSRDEIGILAQAFSSMSNEIKRLLVQTRDKTRMESELKTASLVQERLMPASATLDLGEFEICGKIMTASECGGDWWHYFTKDSDLYVVIADATGHGTAAALITAAARSVFSRLENEILSLEEMMRAWDHAVKSCSHGQVSMTGILMKIDTTTGGIYYIGAGHESPFYFQKGASGTGFAGGYLDLPISTSIGRGLKKDALTEQFILLTANDSLVLYTDGIFAVTNAEGRTPSDKRFPKQIAARLLDAYTAKNILDVVVDEFDQHRAGAPLPDDVALIAIRRKPTSPRPPKRFDSGDITSMRPPGL